MKLVESILLGSAAGLTAVAGAQAADLPVNRAAPVEYVRVCTAFGAGFFYIPGTDTCLRVSGRARGEYNYTSTRSYANAQVSGDVSGFRGLGRLNMDARTQTAYGILRTFVRFDIAYASGGYITSGTQQRFGYAFPALGQDTFARAQTQVSVDKAFIQFAGFTAGRASSFFDFYAQDLEFIAGTSGSANSAQNLFAYTATWGNTGFSSTLSIEDPLARRQPIFATGNIGGTVAAGTIQGGGAANFVNFGSTFVSSVPVAFDPITGLPTAFANVDVAQRERVPDIVGAYRWDGSWGAVQFSTASHEISLGKYQTGVFTAVPGVAGANIPGFAPFTFPTTGTLIGASAGGAVPLATGGTAAGALNGAAGQFVPVREPQARYGYAVQAGVKVNLPMIAPGDVFWLQAAYAHGAMSYTGVPRLPGYESLTQSISGRFVISTDDAVVFANGKVKLTDAASVTAAFLHNWTPQWRQALFGSFSTVQFPNGSRGPFGPLATLQGFVAVPGATSISPAVATVGTFAAQRALAFNSTLRDYDDVVVGSNLVYSPVKDLDIGLEVLYNRITLRNGSVADLNKVGTNGAGGAVAASAGGGTITGNVAGLAPGVPLRTTNFDDFLFTRFRVQRDF